MANIAVLCPPVSGHLNPLCTLGRALRDRGHRVTVIQIPELAHRVAQEGLRFHPLVSSTPDGEDVGKAVAELGARHGLSAAFFTLDCGRRLAEVMLEAGPSALIEEKIDLALVDDNEPAGGTICEHLGLPWVNVGWIPMDREPDLPPGFAPWPYTGRLGTRAKNEMTFAISDLMLLPIHRALNRYRRKWNLAPVHHPPDTLSKQAQLSSLVPELDYPRKRQNPLRRYVGPLFDSKRPEVPFPWDRLNGKPLIYASFGTLQTRYHGQYAAVVEACAGLNAQLVISTGGSAVAVSGDVIAVPYAPQLELLESASLCITHGGVNTTMEAFRCGVPLVVVPVANDQPAVAARVKWVGAGEVLPITKLTPPDLRARVLAVLNEPRYRERAQTLQASIRAAGGVERAADIVEGVLASR